VSLASSLPRPQRPGVRADAGCPAGVCGAERGDAGQGQGQFQPLLSLYKPYVESGEEEGKGGREEESWGLRGWRQMHPGLCLKSVTQESSKLPLRAPCLGFAALGRLSQAYPGVLEVKMGEEEGKGGDEGEVG